ncbi:MAG: T9SS type A sorting domain-containing protein [bacterium]
MLSAILTLALAAVTSLAPSTGVVTPGAWDGGGPDAYGYIWLNSDDTEPGSPTYNWIEIKDIGEEVPNLGDDNVIGPYNIGFEFPYYWYKVTSFYVGSNGYVAFHDNTLNAHEFPPIPNPRRSNNTLAPMMCDLDPSPGGSPNGSVWVWTNANNDTCIIQYDQVAFWNTGGSNTFQVILSRPDSAITFQYKAQTGAPYNGWVGAGQNQCGIENVSGNIGLNYLSGNQPPGNMYRAELAVRFIPPDSTTYEVNDAGIRNAMNDRNGGFFVENGSPTRFWGIAQNFGNQTVADYKAYVRVKRQSGAVVHFDSTMASTPNPGDIDSVVFDQVWTPTQNMTYIVEVFTALSGDVFPANDTAKIECRVLTLPGVLSYDKGVADAYYSWNGEGGYGARFVPPVYPCSITGIRMMSQSATGISCVFGIFADNGPGGSPGDTLYLGTVNVSAPQWYQLNPPSPVVIEEGAFFVGAMSATASDPSFGMDTMPPISGQSWEYTGVWAPSRDLWLREAMFNAEVRVGVGIEEWVSPVPVPAPVRVDVSPNPFGASARLSLVNGRGTETEVEVFDATGSVVRTLELVRGSATFNGRDNAGRLLADGIYFARVRGDHSSVAKVVISR